MIPHSLPFSEFVLIRANSWLVHSLPPQTHPCPSCPTCHNSPYIPPCFLPIEFFSVFSVGSVATTQLRKTNPIPKTPKPPQPLVQQSFTPTFRSMPPEKTNPKQTQSPTRYAIRFTRYEIRDSPPTTAPRQSQPTPPPPARQTARKAL